MKKQVKRCGVLLLVLAAVILLAACGASEEIVVEYASTPEQIQQAFLSANDRYESAQIDSATFDENALGEQTAQFAATDKNGKTRNVKCDVTVIDSTPPEVTVIGIVEMGTAEDHKEYLKDNINKYLSAKDNFDGNIYLTNHNSSISLDEQQFESPGEASFEVTISDSFGNNTKVTVPASIYYEEKWITADEVSSQDSFFIRKANKFYYVTQGDYPNYSVEWYHNENMWFPAYREPTIYSGSGTLVYSGDKDASTIYLQRVTSDFYAAPLQLTIEYNKSNHGPFLAPIIGSTGGSSEFKNTNNLIKIYGNSYREFIAQIEAVAAQFPAEVLDRAYGYNDKEAVVGNINGISKIVDNDSIWKEKGKMFELFNTASDSAQIRTDTSGLFIIAAPKDSAVTATCYIGTQEYTIRTTAFCRIVTVNASTQYFDISGSSGSDIAISAQRGGDGYFSYDLSNVPAGDYLINLSSSGCGEYWIRVE